MSYRFLKGFDSWDIIIKDVQSKKELSLSNEYKFLCPVCFYPIKKKKVKKKCHEGIIHNLHLLSYITGHFYKVDFKGNPINWFAKLLKNISEFPFKHSHELFRMIIEEKMMNSSWKLEEINISTMIPTNNLQMESLFSQISLNLGIKWVPFKQIFIRKDLKIHYDDRREYVNNKYFLKENANETLKGEKKIIIFDDIFNQGFTFGRIIELLKDLEFEKFYIVTIGRTVPKSFNKAFSFP